MPRSFYQRNLEGLKEYDIDDLIRFAEREAFGVRALPDIITFAEHPDFLAKSLSAPLYPRQRTLLRLIYLDTDNMSSYDVEVIDEWANGFYRGNERIGVPPDIWKRIRMLKRQGYSHFREIEFIGGRRGGKGHVGAIIAAYQMYKLLLLENPQEYYGIDPSKDLYQFVTATNFQQARDHQFSDILNTVVSAPCFDGYISHAKSYSLALRTPADMERIKELNRRGVRLEREVASVRAMAMSANSRAGRGAACFSLVFDEFAHVISGTEGPNTGENLYNALTPSLDQLGKDALIYIPSSPYTKTGRAYEIYEDALKIDEETKNPVNPEMLVIQLPSWGPYKDWNDPKVLQSEGIDFEFRSAPQTYNDLMRRLEKRNRDTFKVERRAQWAEVIDAYLDPEMVDRMFFPFCERCGSPSQEAVCKECGFSELRRVEKEDRGVLRWAYRGHADPSKSGHNFTVAIGHTEPFVDKDGDTWHHVIIDWMHAWKPQDYPDHQIPYDEIEDELAQAISRFDNLQVFSYDQFGSFATVSRMKKRLKEMKHRATVKELTATAKSNAERAERFKSALGMGWVHSYKDALFEDGESLLELECKFLQEKNGKVVKQNIGPVRTDDLFDCVSIVTSQLLKDQLDRLYRIENLSQPLQGGASGGYEVGREPPAPKVAPRARNTLRRYQDNARLKGKAKPPWKG